MNRLLIAILLTTLGRASLCAAASAAPTELLPNPSFEEGTIAPDNWTAFAIGGSRWEHRGLDGEMCVSVTGGGADSGWWSPTASPKLRANSLYHLSYWLHCNPEAEGGVAVAGLEWVNRDTSPGDDWERREFSFRTPDAVLTDALFRVGQWHMKGTVFFDHLALVPALAVHARPEALKLPLGAGESVVRGQYRASHLLGGPGTTDFRGLERFTAHFNTNRWVFGGPAEVVYRHEVGRLRQTEAEVEVEINWWEQGTLVVEASQTGERWVRLGEVSKASRVALPVPSELLPTRELWVRLRSVEGAALQVNGYEYRCQLVEADGIARAVGATHYLAVVRTAPDLEVEVGSLGGLAPGGEAAVELTLRNLAGRRAVNVELLIEQAGKTEFRAEERVSLATQAPRVVTVPYHLEASGDDELTIRCLEADSGEVLWEARSEFTVSPLHDARGGELVSDDADLGVWWCEPERKVSKGRPAPATRSASSTVTPESLPPRS